MRLGTSSNDHNNQTSSEFTWEISTCCDYWLLLCSAPLLCRLQIRKYVNKGRHMTLVNNCVIILSKRLGGCHYSFRISDF